MLRTIKDSAFTDHNYSSRGTFTKTGRVHTDTYYEAYSDIYVTYNKTNADLAMKDRRASTTVCRRRRLSSSSERVVCVVCLANAAIATARTVARLP